MTPLILLFIKPRCAMKSLSLFYMHCTSERVKISNAWLQHFSTAFVGDLDDRGIHLWVSPYLFVIVFFFNCKLSPNTCEKLSKFLCCLSISHLVSGYGKCHRDIYCSNQKVFQLIFSPILRPDIFLPSCHSSFHRKQDLHIIDFIITLRFVGIMYH